MKTGANLSPKAYKVLCVLRVVVAVSSLVCGGVYAYFSEYVLSACFFITFVGTAYNAWLFYKTLKQQPK